MVPSSSHFTYTHVYILRHIGPNPDCITWVLLCPWVKHGCTTGGLRSVNWFFSACLVPWVIESKSRSERNSGEYFILHSIESRALAQVIQGPVKPLLECFQRRNFTSPLDNLLKRLIVLRLDNLFTISRQSFLQSNLCLLLLVLYRASFVKRIPPSSLQPYWKTQALS